MRWQDRVRGLRLDLTPWRSSRDFRLLFLAGAVFYLGGMITYVAIPFQLYRLTGSNAAVGLVGLVGFVPLVAGGLYGGALADHTDRRRLLVTAGLAQAAFTALLGVNAALEEPAVWAIYVLAFLLSSCTALQRPSREALLPRTVPHDQLTAANALDSFGMQLGLLLGPAVGGLLLAQVGAAWCYAVDVVMLLAASALFAAMRPYPHRDRTTPPSLSGIARGIGYAASRRDLLGTYLVDLTAMILAMPVVLFPALAEDVFARPELLGLLYTAETVGAVVATLTSGWTGRVHHHGRAIVVAAAAYGLCIALVGLAPTVWWAVLALACAGAADMISGIFRATVWSQTIPESMRGRLAGIEMLSYSLGPLGGQIRAGLVADAWSVRAALTSGGVACVVGVTAAALWLRDFWHYDARTDPYAQVERARRSNDGPGVANVTET